MTSRPVSPTPAGRVALGAGALALDAVLIVVFAGLGRSSHARETSLAGLAETAWPFLVGLALAWLISMAWKRPVAVLRTGIPVWIGTVALGLLLRALLGQGTAVPFIVVTTLTLCAFLLGWRLVVALVRRARVRP